MGFVWAMTEPPPGYFPNPKVSGLKFGIKDVIVLTLPS